MTADLTLASLQGRLETALANAENPRARRELRQSLALVGAIEERRLLDEPAAGTGGDDERPAAPELPTP